MSSSAPIPIDEERRFEPHELFFSLTDAKGIIRYGNDVFTRISGYSEAELIGKPHNIIRHPDMPRAVFKLLWDYIEDGKSIAAYVKNMAKDGRYYWVLATVMPCQGGYLSIRLKPSSPLFEAAKQAYVETLKLEKQIEKETGNRRLAMEKSLERLSEIVVSAGFDSYDQFMSEALSQELKARERHVIPHDGPSPSGRISENGSLAGLESVCKAIEGRLGTLLKSVDAFKKLGDELAAKYEMIQELGPSLQFLALNARMAASRLGDQGIVQAAVADALGSKSKQAESTIAALIEGMHPLRQLTCKQTFDIGVARFEAEVGRLFVKELLGNTDFVHGGRVSESLSIVVGEMHARCQCVVEGMHVLERQTNTTQKDVVDLIGRIVEMKAIQLNGKIEAAAGSGKSDFSVIFNEASKHIEGGRSDCAVLLEVLEASADRITEFADTEQPLLDDLHHLGTVRESFANRQAEPALA